MAGITLPQAQEQLDAALSALASARKAKESQVTGSIGGRKQQNQDVQQLMADVQFWDATVKRLSRGGAGPSFVQVVPCG